MAWLNEQLDLIYKRMGANPTLSRELGRELEEIWRVVDRETSGFAAMARLKEIMLSPSMVGAMAAMNDTDPQLAAFLTTTAAPRTTAAASGAA